MTWLHEVTNDKPRPETELSSVMLRVFCHALIDLMPEKGLEEMAGSLAEALDYYRVPPQQPALPPSSITIPVTLDRAYERPEFYAMEE
jgi:hypothetical protein